MKTAILVGFLCALFITVEPACDSTACSAVTSLTCPAYKTYIDCLTTESSGCTSSQTSQKTGIDAIIAATNAIRGGLGCGAGASAPISIATMILGIIAVFLKN